MGRSGHDGGAGELAVRNFGTPNRYTGRVGQIGRPIRYPFVPLSVSAREQGTKGYVQKLDREHKSNGATELCDAEVVWSAGSSNKKRTKMTGLRMFLRRLYCKLLPVSREYVEARRRTDAVVEESRKITEAINNARMEPDDPIRHFVDSLKGIRKNDTV